MEPITALLKRNARQYGPETALVERDPSSGARRVLSWEAFDRFADRVAAALIGAGMGTGRTVVQLMMNGLEWLPIYFGILRSGAWAVPLNFRFQADDIRRCVRMADAGALIFGPEFVDRIAAIRPALTSTATCVFVGSEAERPDFAVALTEWLEDAPDVPLLPAVSGGEPAALYFTSGTTGAPKGVVLTHENLSFAGMVEYRHHRQTRNDNFLLIPPLYHTGAKMHWFGNLMAGAPSVILKGARPEWILEAVSEERVTIVWLLVPWAHDILVAIDNGRIDPGAYRLAQWRLMHIGAQPVPPSLIHRWKAVFPHHDYDTNYGLTEASGPGCVHLGTENTHRVGAIGKPGYRWECRIVGDDRQPAASGPGELAVRGPGVMRGYFKNPEATAETLTDGWLMTGDIARIDADGFIWLIDRKKDVIITGGENIFPVEIEHVLMSHPDVQDCGVIGLPDERLGEIAAAIVRLQPGKQTADTELFEFCRILPRIKRPRKIIFDDVPRNPTGKIDKPALRAKYAPARWPGDPTASDA